jgi:hypothetical protein
MGCSIDPNPKPLSRPGADPDALTSDAVIGDNEVVRGNGGDRGVQGSDVSINDDGVILAVDGAGGAPGISFAENTALGLARVGGFSRLYGGVSSYLQVDTSRTRFSGNIWPISSGNSDLGAGTVRFGAGHINGFLPAYIETASAQYTADDQDHTIVLTAATAELVLPPADDGTQKYLVQFTGASSRTVTPDSGTSDTVDVSSPTQNKHYWVQSDGVSHWKMVLMD